MAVAPTFNNSKCNETIVGTGNVLFQPHLISKGTISTAELCTLAAELVMADPVYIQSGLTAIARVAKAKLSEGYRVVIDDFARFELTGQGSFEYADEPWDPTRHSIVVNAVAFKDLVESAADVVPTNVLAPTNVQILGMQDATTMEQNTYTKGNTLLIQGKNCKIDTTKAAEGVWVDYGNGTIVKMTVSASTSSTIDATCNDAALVAGEATLVVRSRDGKGDDYMPVEVTKPITIKVAA